MLKDNLTRVIAAALLISPVCGCTLNTLKEVGNLTNVTGQKTEKATVNVEALSVQGAKLVASYAAAMAGVTEAQADLAKAFNLDELVGELESQKASLKSGNLTSVDDADKVVELSEKANEVIAEKMKEQTELSSQAKVAVGKALVKYSIGTAGTAMLIKTAKDVATDTKTYVSSLPWTARASALNGDMLVALNVAKEVPTLTKNLVSTGNSFVEYAVAQGIDTTKAKKEMSALAGF